MQEVADYEAAVADRGEVEGAPAQAERRMSERVTVVIRPGKLIADGREFLCVVRDVSAHGLKMRLFQGLPDAPELAIEFDNGEQHRIAPIWQRGESAGFRFLDTVDVAQLIAAHETPHPPRPPQRGVGLDAILCGGGMRTPAVMRDISQHGASLECAGWLMIDETVRIECDALPTIHAKVRWRRPPRYGVAFEQTFRIEELARACAAFKLHEAGG